MDDELMEEVSKTKCTDQLTDSGVSFYVPAHTHTPI